LAEFHLCANILTCSQHRLSSPADAGGAA